MRFPDPAREKASASVGANSPNTPMDVPSTGSSHGSPTVAPGSGSGAASRAGPEDSAAASLARTASSTVAGSVTSADELTTPAPVPPSASGPPPGDSATREITVQLTDVEWPLVVIVLLAQR